MNVGDVAEKIVDVGKLVIDVIELVLDEGRHASSSEGTTEALERMRDELRGRKSHRQRTADALEQARLDLKE